MTISEADSLTGLAVVDTQSWPMQVGLPKQRIYGEWKLLKKMSYLVALPKEKFILQAVYLLTYPNHYYSVIRIILNISPSSKLTEILVTL